MVNKRDYWPTKEWQTAKLADVGMDPQYLTDFEYIINSKYKNINGIVVVRKGYIVYERYYNGYCSIDTHNVASVTKSFISALIGIAIDGGYIKSVDQKVMDFFPEYLSDSDNILKRTITIKHLLTMTAPFPWKQEPLDRLRRQKDWVKYTLDQLGRNGQIGKFQYSTAGVHLLSAIITRATGMTAREFANKHLFKPIGIKEISDYKMKSFKLDDVFGKNITGWIKDPQGNTSGGWGLTITPRDMARFGFLYLNHGVWDSKHIVSEKWIDESTSWDNKQIISEKWIESTAMNTCKYGYLWWLFNLENTLGYTAAGSGGNHIFCIPKKDLVVVIASKIIQKPQDRWTLLEKYIIPSILD